MSYSTISGFGMPVAFMGRVQPCYFITWPLHQGCSLRQENKMKGRKRNYRLQTDSHLAFYFIFLFNLKYSTEIKVYFWLALLTLGAEFGTMAAQHHLENAFW